MIDEARKAGFPSMSHAREVERCRRKVLITLPPDHLKEAEKELERAIRKARSIQRLQWPIRISAYIFGILSLFAFMTSFAYGYELFLVPTFGLPETEPFTLFISLVVLRYGWKGILTERKITENRKRNERRKSMLWYDKVKSTFEVDFLNMVLAGMMAAFFAAAHLFA